MKQTIWTTAGVALVLGFIALSSSSAEASSAKAKFAAMKKALNAQQARTQIKLQMATGADGKPKSKIYINGQLMDVKDGVPFEYHDGDTKVIVSSSSGGTTNLNDLPPDVREKVQKALKDARSGRSTGNVKVIKSEGFFIDGKEVSKGEAQRIFKKLGVDPGVDFDFEFNFNEDSYSKIAFGPTENTLLLTPKKQKGVRYALALNPRTSLPSMVTMQVSGSNKWRNINSSSFVYKPKGKK